MNVWIVFSLANNYDQPDKAFELLLWEEPTESSLKDIIKIYGISKNQIESLLNLKIIKNASHDSIWIEKFTSPTHIERSSLRSFKQILNNSKIK